MSYGLYPEEKVKRKEVRWIRRSMMFCVQKNHSAPKLWSIVQSRDGWHRFVRHSYNAWRLESSLCPSAPAPGVLYLRIDRSLEPYHWKYFPITLALLHSIILGEFSEPHAVLSIYFFCDYCKTNHFPLEVKTLCWSNWAVRLSALCRPSILVVSAKFAKWFHEIIIIEMSSWYVLQLDLIFLFTVCTSCAIQNICLLPVEVGRKLDFWTFQVSFEMTKYWVHIGCLGNYTFILNALWTLFDDLQHWLFII